MSITSSEAQAAYSIARWRTTTTGHSVGRQSSREARGAWRHLPDPCSLCELPTATDSTCPAAHPQGPNPSQSHSFRHEDITAYVPPRQNEHHRVDVTTGKHNYITLNGEEKPHLHAQTEAKSSFANISRKSIVLCFPNISKRYYGRFIFPIKCDNSISQWYLLNNTFLKGSQLAYKEVMYRTGYKQIHVQTKMLETFSTEYLKDIHSNNHNVLWILNKEMAAFQKIHFPKTAYNSVCQ